MNRFIVCLTLWALFIGASPSEYEVRILDVYDGDTVTLEYDLGFGLKRVSKARLYGINTPEIKGAEAKLGAKARAFLIDLCKENKVVAKIEGQDKYGRDLMSLKCGGKAVAVEMIKSGNAKAYFGEKKEAFNV